jgi:3'(2'), 5'-bisphosphate nucleotidase
MQDRTEIVRAMLEAALTAGDRILAVSNEALATERKADLSPVTAADRAADKAITDILGEKLPAIPIISEENTASHAQAPAGPYFLVDPLDGTRGFVEGSDEFTVNIGLIENGQPTLGVVLVPRWRELYWVTEDGRAMRQRGDVEPAAISARPPPNEGLVAIVSRTSAKAETAAFLATLTIARELTASSSLKFCQLASGFADIYPRFGPTCEWDTAAGDAILRAAGGTIRTPDGALLAYGKPKWLNGSFIARGR